MKAFPKGFKIPRYFGDFGGDYSERDTVAPLNNSLAEEFEGFLTDDAFYKKFAEVLSIVHSEEIKVEKVTTSDGRTVYIAPSLAKSYALAGYLTIALIHGREKVVTGTYSRELAEAFVNAAKKLSLYPKICLGRDLCHDKSLTDALRAQGAEVDDLSCLKMLDAPYAYINFDEGMGFEVIPIEANYGIYPRAAMTGLLASQYGEDLKALLTGAGINTVCVAIKTGTEAIGVMRAFADDDVKLATVERRICKEFHTEDAGCYTLVTRTDGYGIPDTSLNPELCHWWRTCKAYRLGADRVNPVDTSSYTDLPLSENGKRALKLTIDQLDAKNILFVEEGQG